MLLRNTHSLATFWTMVVTYFLVMISLHLFLKITLALQCLFYVIAIDYFSKKCFMLLELSTFSLLA